MKKTTCFWQVVFFNEINPFGICEIAFGSEILLRNVKCAAAREGFISFHLMRQH